MAGSVPHDGGPRRTMPMFTASYVLDIPSSTEGGDQYYSIEEPIAEVIEAIKNAQHGVPRTPEFINLNGIMLRTSDLMYLMQSVNKDHPFALDWLVANEWNLVEGYIVQLTMCNGTTLTTTSRISPPLVYPKYALDEQVFLALPILLVNLTKVSRMTWVWGDLSEFQNV